ncbi:MAG TPA: phosphotransferase family protein [Acidimicrobiales bacterium]
MGFTHDLPVGVTDWVESIGQGTITCLERHVARREAWVVDVRRDDGSVLEGFLRIDRDPKPNDPWSLCKEARIIEALGPSTVPVPALYGWHDGLSCALFQRAPGRSDLDKLTDTAQQRRVMEDFMRVVGELHNLELDSLGLDDVMPARPQTPEQCALGEVDLILSTWDGFLSSYCEPLITFGVGWLRRNVPQDVARVSLVQGDTGPVNFLFDGDRVSAVIDWEWGHYGDPMEDLGNICVRELWNPSGGLTGLFELYARESGIPYSRAAVQYYRVQQNVRGMVPIHAVTMMAHPREPIAWYIVYRYVGDRATCEAIAEASGVELERPELPDDDSADDILAAAAQYALEHDVRPAVSDAFATSRIGDVAILVQCMERKCRYGALVEAMQLDELAKLLGSRPSSLTAGLASLDEALRDGRIDDAEALQFLGRRAYLDEWLYAPAVSLYPDRQWSPID